jgi:hypothetical protein
MVLAAERTSLKLRAPLSAPRLLLANQNGHGISMPALFCNCTNLLAGPGPRLNRLRSGPLLQVRSSI